MMALRRGRERERVLVHRELLDLGEQRLERARLLGQPHVVPGGRRERRQHELVRHVDPGTKPEHLAQWFAPDNFTCDCDVDFRLGGAHARY
jgi:hypothetical protein